MLAPQEALAVLGNETRLQILRTLGAADEPLAFSDLFDRIDYDTTANFSYHLGKLEGHFVDKADEGYVLRQAGRRVIEAVLAEAQPESAVVERVEVDQPCFLCGEPVEVSYRHGHVGMYCPSCGGTRNGASTTALGRTVDAADVLGYLSLPPAGVLERSPSEVLEAASVWTTIESLAVANGVCPRCSAALDNSGRVCEGHDAGDGRCADCGQRFAVALHHDCTNCIFSVKAPFATFLLDDPDLIRFMIDHGIDLLGPNGFHMSALEEHVVSVDPFEARFTFTVDGDAVTLTVGDDFAVVDTSKHGASGTVTERREER